MRFVIQRVNHAKCTIDGNITGSIEKGLCVLIGRSIHTGAQCLKKAC